LSSFADAATIAFWSPFFLESLAWSSPFTKINIDEFLTFVDRQAWRRSQPRVVAGAGVE